MLIGDIVPDSLFAEHPVDNWGIYTRFPNWESLLLWTDFYNVDDAAESVDFPIGTLYVGKETGL